MRPAGQEDWITHRLPEQHVVLRADWRYTPDEAQRMRLGLVPQVMEDKWFVYYADGWLFFHRSWTGFCIYEVELQEAEDGVHIGEICVSRDLEQYRETTAEYDLPLLRYIIDRLLLGMEAPFPLPSENQSPVDGALLRHSTMGFARSRDEIEQKQRDDA